MFCKPKVRDDASRHSQEIERELNNDAKKQKEYIQLLLLGTGESGKTTIIKQMKVIHINGFSDDEKKEKIYFIKQNIHESIFDIIYNMDKISPPITIEKENIQKSAKYILDIGPFNDKNLFEFTEEYYNHVKILWQDSAIQETFNRSNEFQLIDSAKHFLDRIDEVSKSNYIPTTQDVLICRIITTNISKIEFHMPVPQKHGGGKAKFWMYDVGGQRGHRKRWISVFEGVQSILFLIAASDFDQKLREDESQNRLKESFELFADIFWSRYLRTAGMIVFLNKQDLLKQKIDNGKKLDDYFPEYATFKTNINDNYERSKLFMKEKLIDISKIKPNPKDIGLIAGLNELQEVDDRTVYIHFTIATDTNNIKLVFNSVHEIILNENIKVSLY